MTDSEFENIMKIVAISIGSLIAIFFISFGFYYQTVITPDADRTFVDKTGWTINQGVFHKQVDCWGETIYTIGDKQVAYNHSWTAKGNQTVYTKNLQEGITYSTYEKKYFFLFVPANFYIIESDCGELK